MDNKYEAIIFDLGGVILNLDYNATINAFKKLGGNRFDELYTQSHQEGVFDLYETGKISSGEFRDYFKKYLESSITDQMIDDAWNAMLLDLPSSRIELLKELKNKFPIFLFSNTNDIHYHAFQKIIESSFGDKNLLESIFNKTYYSHLVGERKPNAQAFQLVIDQNNLTPEKTLFIDDSIQHIEGAQKLGIQTIHLIDQSITDIF